MPGIEDDRAPATPNPWSGPIGGKDFLRYFRMGSNNSAYRNGRPWSLGGSRQGNPWGGASSYGYYPQQQGQAQQNNQWTGGAQRGQQAANPWTSAQTWVPSNAQKPAYDLNAAKRMAYLEGGGGVGQTEKAEWDYLNSLKSQAPGYQQQPATAAPTANDQLMQNLQMLPQLQQYISQLGGLPGQPSNQERWQTLLNYVLQGKDPSAVLKSGRFWGGI